MNCTISFFNQLKRGLTDITMQFATNQSLKNPDSRADDRRDARNFRCAAGERVQIRHSLRAAVIGRKFTATPHHSGSTIQDADAITVTFLEVR